jgi:hypothetical protein
MTDKRVPLPDGTIAVFPAHLTDEEVEERVRSHVELAAIGVSRSPRAAPAEITPALSATTPVYAKPEWEPPAPRPEESWSQSYVREKAAQQRAAFFRVYGRHLGRRMVRVR